MIVILQNSRVVCSDGEINKMVYNMCGIQEYLLVIQSSK